MFGKVGGKCRICHGCGLIITLNHITQSHHRLNYDHITLTAYQSYI